MKILYTLIVFLLAVNLSFSQASLVRNRLQAVALGKIDDVKRELPDLLAEFPKDPGIQFLHGIVLEDASLALKIYEEIVKEHPDCEWADDAQWRIVQFYALKNDTSRAHKELTSYREKYPQSEFLLNASEMVKATVGLPKFTEKPVATTESKSGKVPSKTVIIESKPITKPKDSKTPELKTSPKDNKSSTSNTIVAKAIEKDKLPSSLTAKKDTIHTIAKPTISGKEISKKESWSLQVASYDSKESAEAEVKEYKKKRLRASILEKSIDGKTNYAVLIGEYTTREAADKAKVIVEKSCNCSPFVVEKGK
ncbi:MAG: SPOR domain-containing protein [Bacteroidetes bacterium]|nr:SPOR domain-containing protein [Bacteroidota bacterium]